MVRLLLDSGADIHASDNLMEVPLHVAELLMARGAEVNARDAEAATALHGAAEQEREQIVRFLVFKGDAPIAGVLCPAYVTYAAPGALYVAGGMG